MPKRAAPASAPPLAPPSTPPQRRLGLCPGCGLTVMAEAWQEVAGTWQPRGAVTSPALGHPHDCGLALIQYAAHWQYVVVLAHARTVPTFHRS